MLLSFRSLDSHKHICSTYIYLYYFWFKYNYLKIIALSCSYTKEKIIMLYPKCSLVHFMYLFIIFFTITFGLVWYGLLVVCRKRTKPSVSCILLAPLLAWPLHTETKKKKYKKSTKQRNKLIKYVFFGYFFSRFGFMCFVFRVAMKWVKKDNLIYYLDITFFEAKFYVSFDIDFSCALCFVFFSWFIMTFIYTFCLNFSLYFFVHVYVSKWKYLVVCNGEKKVKQKTKQAFSLFYANDFYSLTIRALSVVLVWLGLAWILSFIFDNKIIEWKNWVLCANIGHFIYRLSFWPIGKCAVNYLFIFALFFFWSRICIFFLFHESQNKIKFIFLVHYLLFLFIYFFIVGCSYNINRLINHIQLL